MTSQRIVPQDRAEGQAPGRLQGRSELGVAAGLAALALVVGFDTANIRQTAIGSGVLGPQVVPTLIAVGLGVTAVALAIDVLRGGRGEPEEGEDIDLGSAAHWPTLLGLGALILATAFLIQPLGFVIAMAAMFYGSALLLGSKRYIWALIIGVLLSLATFYGFVLGLGIPLPAGILTGIL